MIPTAEEFEESHGNDPYMLIKFAKLHVEAALEEAAYNAEIMDERDGDSGEGAIYINKQSILKAYPLTNIK